MSAVPHPGSPHLGPHVLREDREGICTLTLNRPQQMNLLTTEMLSSLQNAFDELRNDSGTRVVWADYIVLATGSRPRYLPELPIDEKIVMTSDGIEHMEDFPESMVIVGAGVIGCEFATIFSAFVPRRQVLSRR